MSGLPRSVVKWLQGLDLTFVIKNPKWDFSNGFLVAEIFSWYYPDDVKLMTYNTGQSLDAKMTNWSFLKKFVVKKELNIPMELLDATLHCKDGAAVILIETLYTILTNRPIQKAEPEFDIDLTDWAYQQKLPFHARSTASKSIKNNIRSTELQTDPNLRLATKKVESIIAQHVDHRRAERDENPSRFNVKKTLAERCLQRPLPSFDRKTSDFSFDYGLPPGSDSEKPSLGIDSATFLIEKSISDKNYKEIRVNQEVYEVNMGNNVTVN